MTASIGYIKFADKIWCFFKKRIKAVIVIAINSVLLCIYLLCLRYDHLRKEASDFKPVNVDQTAEPWRKEVESHFTTYVHNHYKSGICTVYGSTENNNVTIIACIESHQFQPKNFWCVFSAKNGSLVTFTYF